MNGKPTPQTADDYSDHDLALAEALSVVDEYGAVERLEAENATLSAALQKIAELEPRDGFMSESDWGHMSGPDTCDGCKEAIELARAALSSSTEGRTDGGEVEHIDGDPTNNELSNLRIRRR